jgi:WD40 repeat protein
LVFGEYESTVYLFSVQEDEKSIIQWDVNKEKKMFELQGHKKDITRIHFSYIMNPITNKAMKVLISTSIDGNNFLTERYMQNIQLGRRKVYRGNQVTR